MYLLIIFYNITISSSINLVYINYYYYLVSLLFTIKFITNQLLSDFSFSSSFFQKARLNFCQSDQIMNQERNVRYYTISGIIIHIRNESQVHCILG